MRPEVPRAGEVVGEATLVAVGPVRDGRLVGWEEDEVTFSSTGVFDALDGLDDLVAASDLDLMAVLEAPSPRYSLRRLVSTGDRLVVEAGCTDWSFVNGVQDVLFRAAPFPRQQEVQERWTASSRSITATGRPAGFSHHLGVHTLLVSRDGYVVTCVRRQVSNQAGRVSLSCEEQMDVAHVSTRGWQTARRLTRVNGDRSPVAAIRRGLREEFGLRPEEVAVRVLGVSTETASIAVNFLACARSQLSLEEIRCSHASAVDRAENEVLPPERSLRLEAVRDGSAAVNLAGPRGPLGPWHSSSMARLRLTLAHTQSVEA